MKTKQMSDWEFNHYETDVLKSLKQLPEYVFYLEPVSNKIVVILRGQPGYRTPRNKMPDHCKSEWTMEELNKGFSHHQVQAMINGSMFGWHVPGSDVSYLKELERRKKVKGIKRLKK